MDDYKNKQKEEMKEDSTSAYVECPFCRGEIKIQANKCKHCHKKLIKKPMPVIYIGFIIIVCSAALIFFPYDDVKRSMLSIFESFKPPVIMSLEEMVEKATTISYDDLARYPDRNKGKPVIYQGNVVQKISNTHFRVDIAESIGGTNIIYLELRGDSRNARILEDDRILFVGLANGELTYKAILGNHITIPRIHAYKVHIK